jgi:hypothetical protein
MYSVLYYFYVINRVKREEAVLQSVFGEPYRRYCLHVHAFLPSCRSVTLNDVLFFRWPLFVRNHGPLNLLGVVLFWVAMYYAIFMSWQ